MGCGISKERQPAGDNSANLPPVYYSSPPPSYSNLGRQHGASTPSITLREHEQSFVQAIDVSPLIPALKDLKGIGKSNYPAGPSKNALLGALARYNGGNLQQSFASLADHGSDNGLSGDVDKLVRKAGRTVPYWLNARDQGVLRDNLTLAAAISRPGPAFGISGELPAAGYTLNLERLSHYQHLFDEGVAKTYSKMQAVSPSDNHVTTESADAESVSDRSDMSHSGFVVLSLAQFGMI